MRIGYGWKRHSIGGAAALLVAILAGSLSAGTKEPLDTEGTEPMRSIVEIRSYHLRSGTRDAFHQLVVEESVPLLRRWEVDLIAYGPSRHDEDSYYLIRGFTDLEERQRIEEGFYGSDEWRSGPRDSILSLIESYTTVVLELDAATIDGLRTAGGMAVESDFPRR